MQPLSVVVLIAICTIVWGGFLTFLVRALRAESRRDHG
jgi:hypothetical protein